MADAPIPSLSRAREQKISELSQHFANDDLSLEDLERRIERVYKAANVVELEQITADLRQAVLPAQNPIVPSRISGLGRPSGAVPAAYELESTRVLSLMSSTKRVGRWAVPRKVDVLAIMSETRIDLTQAVLPPGVIDLNLRVVMASFKLIVPPNVRVVNEMHSVMADVRSKAHELLPDGAPEKGESTVIRLRGYAFMAEAKIVVRRKEEPVYSDDDDDDDAD
ncbi:MAG TPA: LiaF domain-containing protein [Gemmatimonadaceae bacterium]|nr:LiaF domain-containing protein [Gemmatimonadaceae bacterium]